MTSERRGPLSTRCAGRPPCDVTAWWHHLQMSSSHVTTAGRPARHVVRSVAASALVAVVLVGCGGSTVPPPDEGAAAASSAAPSPTQAPSGEASPSPTVSPSPVPTPSAEPSRSPTPSPEPSPFVPVGACETVLAEAPAASPDGAPVVTTEPVTSTPAGNEVDLERLVVDGVATADAIEAVVDAELEAAMTAHDETVADYGDDPDVPGPWLDGRIEVGLVDERTVSYRLDLAFYFEGAAHPLYASRGGVIAVEDGRELELADLGIDERCQALRELLEAWGLAQDPVLNEVSVLLDPNHELEEWSLTDEGVAFHFGHYEIAAGVAGAPTITIPFDALIELAPNSWLVPAHADRS